ncbi:MAG: hypothetical protein QM401_10480 [Bacillota bacterium]|nr:hypothetical protein [Bacillota bacterium]
MGVLYIVVKKGSTFDLANLRGVVLLLFSAFIIIGVLGTNRFASREASSPKTQGD